MATANVTFYDRIESALSNENLQRALDGNFERSLVSRTAAMDALPQAEAVRDRARAIRIETLSHLDQYLLQFEEQVTAHGGVVHWAADAEQANQIVLRLVQETGTHLVAKSKSMVTEEIGLNATLQQKGIQVVETDLGEYILQLRGEKPSHIVAPAIHLTRDDVARTFAEKLHTPSDIRADPSKWGIPAMTAMARSALRKVFLDAGVGISGVNFGVAETGGICLVSNEGNGRMVTTLPPVHIAVMGIERIVPTLADLEVMLRVLARSATGQKITCYTSILTGPRRRDEADGPEQLHLVLVDNGRSNVLGSDLAESLLCIRCGACLNICPVYREIGGHAYDSVYSGPIGAILSPALGGLHEYGELAQASSLCGACQDVCPVRIDIPGLLLKTRALHLDETGGELEWNLAMRGWAWCMQRPARLAWSTRLARMGQRLVKLLGLQLKFPPPLNGWTDHREFPGLAPQTFHERWASGDVQRKSRNGEAPHS